jgi:hypothetical protein
MIEMIWTMKPSYFMTTRRVDGDGSVQVMEQTQVVAALIRRQTRR